MKKRIRTVCVCFAAAGLLLLLWRLDLPNWKKLDLDKIRSAPESTIAYDADGREIGALAGGSPRRYLRLSAIPENVRSAFIAAEDQRFYTHGGIDVRRIFGALKHDLATRSLAQGASTITQQLIKLTHLTGEKTLARKAQEIVLALRLEKKLTKDEILEAYLNAVYFGSGAYGISAAAETYFGKRVNELTLAESALLAGVIKSPSGYAPDKHPDRARERRDLILKSMLSLEMISQKEYDAAVKEAVTLSMRDGKRRYGWMLDEALEEASSALNMETEEVLSAGLHIYTGFRPAMQDAADALFENGANFPDPAADSTPAQATLIALDTRTGEIAAIIGGREYAVRRGLNRATGMRRQPGSAIKPVSVYAAAIEHYDYLPSSAVEDVQRDFGGYRPGNAGGNYYGTVTLREALSRSLNAATVDLADRIGMNAVRDQALAFGLPLAKEDANLSLALGAMTYGVSPANLCAAYCALVNGGMSVVPHIVRRITSASGRTLWEAPVSGKRAVSAQTAFLMTDMLKTAASEGSAKALADVGIPVAGKTGTAAETDGGNRDIWTACCTPELAVTVWMGFDEPDAAHALPDWAGGSGYPARLCAAFLKSIRPQLSGHDFDVPNGLQAVRIDSDALEKDHAVLLAAKNAPAESARTEWFPEDRLPTEVSARWSVPAAVDDLRLISERGEAPVLTFTSKSDAAEYLILRRRGGDTEIAAALRADAGEAIVWKETENVSDTETRYSVLPRSQALYENGTTLTGTESPSVTVQAETILDRIFG